MTASTLMIGALWATSLVALAAVALRIRAAFFEAGAGSDSAEVEEAT